MFFTNGNQNLWLLQKHNNTLYNTITKIKNENLFKTLLFLNYFFSATKIHNTF